MCKEKNAELSEVESFLNEPAEEIGALCGVCGGKMFRFINDMGGYSTQCVDCHFELREE